ncbi:MAG: hypothetical protein DMF42_05435 [Verrucomicrobia bacterium]|nr:MAG: hypothetical protein AUH28_06290 [Acidobacteria bacterium 13_1_40CM_56_16]PYL42974.1 MAG: hypothetical protein DMF42_05435 [Verrucomicrobiota bacterium]PYS17007.1 MAG: hypothetical protein DMG17_11100 [Acidobacteriota bacterium]
MAGNVAKTVPLRALFSFFPTRSRRNASSATPASDTKDSHVVVCTDRIKLYDFGASYLIEPQIKDPIAPKSGVKVAISPRVVAQDFEGR